MARRIIIPLLFSLFLITCRAPVYAQGPQEEDAPQEASQAEAAPQPEAPKHISTIILEKDLLSVEFVNVNFGEILRSIGQKAGFQIEGSSPVFNKQVTTKFTDLDLEKGIVRLFSLVKENNYLISYDGKGSIAKVKIPSPGATGKTSSYRVGTAGSPQTPATSRFDRRRSRRFQQPAAGANLPVPQPAPPQPEQPEEAPDEEPEE